jgi:hypothetical protein
MSATVLRRYLTIRSGAGDDEIHRFVNAMHATVNTWGHK